MSLICKLQSTYGHIIFTALLVTLVTILLATRRNVPCVLRENSVLQTYRKAYLVRMTGSIVTLGPPTVPHVKQVSTVQTQKVRIIKVLLHSFCNIVSDWTILLSKHKR